MSEVLTKEEEQEMIEYGIERLKANCIGGLIILGSGLFFGVFRESILFFIVFYLLRRYVGGYHADTQKRCYIISFSIILFSICLIKYINKGTIICLILQTINIVIIYLLAPVGNANRMLDEFEIRRYRKKARFWASITYVLACYFYINSFFNVANSIGVGNCMVGCLLIAGEIKERDRT